MYERELTNEDMREACGAQALRRVVLKSVSAL
jgi:hypothetical protein